MRLFLAIALSLSCAACGNGDDPASYVTGLRIFAIKAEPPDIAAGASSTITALALDTDGNAIAVDWAQCLDAPLQGQSINPDCITNDTADFLVPFGGGLSVTAVMPPLDLSQVGRPDGSGGIYVPLVAHVSAGSDSLVATYSLRRNLGAPPNQNPVLTGMFHVLDGAAGQTGMMLAQIDDTHPLVVHAGDEITLRAAFMSGSAEMYSIYDLTGTPQRTLTETLSVDWFSTAGYFSNGSTGADVTDTILHLDENRNSTSLHLPDSGGTIDLWAVARDERGGTDYLHEVLTFQ